MKLDYFRFWLTHSHLHPHARWLWRQECAGEHTVSQMHFNVPVIRPSTLGPLRSRFQRLSREVTPSLLCPEHCSPKCNGRNTQRTHCPDKCSLWSSCEARPSTKSSITVAEARLQQHNTHQSNQKFKYEGHKGSNFCTGTFSTTGKVEDKIMCQRFLNL